MNHEIAPDTEARLGCCARHDCMEYSRQKTLEYTRHMISATGRLRTGADDDGPAPRTTDRRRERGPAPGTTVSTMFIQDDLEFFNVAFHTNMNV